MKQKYWVFALFTVLLWALASVLIRLVFSTFSAFELTAARSLISGVILLVVCIIKKLPPPKLRDLPIFFVAGAFGFSFSSVVNNFGLAVVTAATANVALAATPIFTALIARFFLKERIRPLGWVFTGVSFVGILILVLWNGALSINAGVLWILLAAITLSIYNLMQRKLTKRYSALQSCTYCFLASAIQMSPFLPSAFRNMVSAAPIVLLVFIFLMLAASVSYLAWSKAFAIAKRTADVSNFMYLPPFIGAILAFAIFRELPDWGTVIGGVIILFGLWMFEKKA